MLDRFHPLGNRLPVGLRNIPIRPEIEHGLLSEFRALALILDKSIGVVGFSIKPKKSTEIAYDITSVPKDRGRPENLLAWNRGHWSIENNNHRVRDVNFKEDACLSRTMHAPNNGAICIALAIIVRRSPNIAETRRYFNLHRHEAVKAVLSSR